MRVDCRFPIRLFCFPTLGTPHRINWSTITSVRHDRMVFLSHQLQSAITTYITALCQFIITGHERAQQLFGHDPAIIHVPLTQIYLQQPSSQSLEFQCAITDLLTKWKLACPQTNSWKPPIFNIRLKEKLSKTPIPRAGNVFIAGSGKTGKAAITCQENEEWKHCISYGHVSTQRAELTEAIMALHQWPYEPLSLVCDAGYTVHTLLHIDQTLLKGSIDPLYSAYF